MQKVSWCTFTAGSVIYLAASGAIRIATISGAERRKWNDYGAHIFARREAGPHRLLDGRRRGRRPGSVMPNRRSHCEKQVLHLNFGRAGADGTNNRCVDGVL